MAASGKAVLVDGLATRVQRPRGWANQKVLYDAKRHTHTAQGLAVSTVWGDLLWVEGGAGQAAVTSTSSSSWRGWTTCWTTPRSPACWTAGSVGWPRVVSTGMRQSAIAAPGIASPTPSGRSTACRRGYGRWWSSRSPIWQAHGRRVADRGLLYGARDLFRAAGALICLDR